MKFSLGLRALALLRRIALSLARIADAQETLARVASSRYAEEHPARRKSSVEFGHLDVKDSEARWRKERADAMMDAEP